jgi:hypothetical protein
MEIHSFHRLNDWSLYRSHPHSDFDRRLRINIALYNHDHGPIYTCVYMLNGKLCYLHMK